MNRRNPPRLVPPETDLLWEFIPNHVTANVAGPHADLPVNIVAWPREVLTDNTRLIIQQMSNTLTISFLGFMLQLELWLPIGWVVIDVAELLLLQS